jgi:hypothetical protein
MLASVQHMQRPKACVPSKELKGHTRRYKAEDGWRKAQLQGQLQVGWCLGAWPHGAGRGAFGRGLGRLVCLSSEEEADIIAPDVNKHVDTGADASQEQLMSVQAHPHVQCTHAAAAATSEQLGAVATGCAVHAIIQHVGIRFPAVRGCVYVAL